VDQAAEEITPLDLWHDLHRFDIALLVGYSKLDPAVRTFGIVTCRSSAAPWTAPGSVETGLLEYVLLP
jgi:hypothetical protein